MIHKTLKNMAGVLMASLLPFMTATAVYAEDTSISIKLQSVEDGEVYFPEDGVLTAYLLTDSYSVDENGNYTFHYLTADFDGASASVIEASIDAGDESLYVSKSEQTISTDGTAKFSSIPYGVYLISQTTTSLGFERMNPTLVTICDMTNAEYIGDHVIIEPKIETKTYFPMVIPTGIQMNLPILATFFGILGIFGFVFSKNHTRGL